jgi:hypothetical protein
LRNDLLSILEKDGLDKSMRKAYSHVASCFQDEKAVMSYTTFNNFMKSQNQARNGLKKDHRKWLQEFVAKHTIAVQDATVVVQAGAGEPSDVEEALHSNDMQVGDFAHV